MKRTIAILLVSSLLLSCMRKNHGQQVTQAVVNDPFHYDDYYFLDSLSRHDIKPTWENGTHVIDTFLRDSILSEIGGIDTLEMADNIIYAVRIYSRPVGFTSHQCGALCSVSFFRKDTTRKYVFLRSSVIADFSHSTYGTFGNYADIRLISIGPGMYAYMVQPSFTGQGITLSSLYLFEVTDSLHINKVLGMDDAANDNSLMYNENDPQGVVPYSYSSELSFNDPSLRHTDIKVRKKGTASVGNKIINIDSSFIYVYEKGRYELLATKDNEKNTNSK
ncbi:MAG: hypothetical protein JWO03_2365 [Bacteroidetes bacterium]|nr:hypothetical protein [Bacteroidota bacterium]